jgi:energy-converting hydrogenase Eha subunit A
MNFLNFWYNMVVTVKMATVVLVIGGGIAGIFAVVFFSILKLRKINPSLAIMVSTVASCFFMVPVISAFNNLVDIKIEGSIISEGKAEIKAQQAEVARLKAENRIRDLEREKLENQITMAKQSIEIEALNDNIKLLENAELSMRSFQKILEVALLQTDVKQTLVRKEPLTALKEGWGILADYSYDEALVVITHDIQAKFGVDLNAVKVSKLAGNTIAVSGIRSKFIGTSRNVSDPIVKEYRTLNYKKGVVSSVNPKYDSSSRGRVDREASAYESEFQRKLSEGLELDFMNDAVIQLAQNFLKVMLAPVYKDIRFTDEEQPGALPVMIYLQKELEENQHRKNELLEINENLLLVEYAP